MALGWLVNASPSFKDCIHSHKNDRPYQRLHENPSIVEGLPVRVELLAVCVEDWTEKYEGAIGALATVFIAVFTLTLWGATKRLWQSAESQLAEFRRSLEIADKHAGDMEKSVAEAARAASAMESFADQTVALVIEMRRQANTAERALLRSLDRPIIILSTRTIPQKTSTKDAPGHYAPTDWEIVIGNYGNAPAVITSIQFEAEAFKEPVDLAAIKNQMWLRIPEFILGLNDTFRRDLQFTSRIGEITPMEIFTRTKGYYLHGRIGYLDPLGNEREYVFMRRLDPHGGGYFTRVGGDRHNYDRETDGRRPHDALPYS